MILWMLYICFFTKYVRKNYLTNISVAKQYVFIPLIFVQTFSVKIKILGPVCDMQIEPMD